MFLIDLTCVFLALKIEDVNWQSKLNKAAHHTSDYSSAEAILRRGQPFSITLSLRAAAAPANSFTFIASTGNFPVELTSRPSHSSTLQLYTVRSWVIKLCPVSFRTRCPFRLSSLRQGPSSLSEQARTSAPKDLPATPQVVFVLWCLNTANLPLYSPFISSPDSTGVNSPWLTSCVPYF